MIQQFHSEVFAAKECKCIPQSNICVRIFIATLFVRAEHPKELRCPSARKWINKIWYFHKMQCCSLIRNELVIPTTMDEFQKRYVEQKNPGTEDYTV